MYLCTFTGLVIGSTLGFGLQEFISYGFYAFFDRNGLEKAVERHFGDATYEDLVVDELLTPSFEYSYNLPRFFSKEFSKIDPGRHDVPIRIAAAASSSAPVYFDP